MGQEKDFLDTASEITNASSKALENASQQVRSTLKELFDKTSEYPFQEKIEEFEEQANQSLHETLEAPKTKEFINQADQIVSRAEEQIISGKNWLQKLFTKQA